jgi:hypothetical protein
MFPFRRWPVKANWWTILPVLASVVLWGAIIHVGLRTKAAFDDKAGRATYAEAAARAEALTQKPLRPKDCRQPGCDGPAPTR